MFSFLPPDGLDPETVTACSVSLSLQLPFLSSAGRNSSALDTQACVRSKDVLETYHGLSDSAEVTILRAAAQIGASGRQEDVMTMGVVACGRAENNYCPGDMDSESFQDPGVAMMPLWSEKPVAAEQAESGVNPEFAQWEQIGNVGREKVEVSDEVLPADQSRSGMSKRLEDSKEPELTTSKESTELTGLVDFKESSALTRDENVDDHAVCVSGKKGKESGPLGLFDANESAFEDVEEELELCVSEECEDFVKDSGESIVADSKTRVLCCAEDVDHSDNESRLMLIPLRSIANYSSRMSDDGLGETSAPLTVATPLHPASGSRSSPIPPHVTDHEDVTNSIVIESLDCDHSLGTECGNISNVSELMGSLDKVVSAAHPVNGHTTVDYLASDHCNVMLAPCLNKNTAVCNFLNEDISESWSIGENMSNNGTLSSCPECKDAIDDNILVSNAAETEAGAGEHSSASCITNSTCSSAFVVIPDLADVKQKLPVTSLLKSDATDHGCEIPVTLPASSDVTGVGSSNGSCDIDVAPTETLSCSELSVSSAFERDRMETGSSTRDSIVLDNNHSNGSAGNQDSVRSKVGALLAKYGRNVADYEKSSDVRSALTEEKNSLLSSGSAPFNERTQVSISYQPTPALYSPSAKLKDTDADLHRYISERDDLRNRHDLTVLVDSSVLVNNINNSNSCNRIYDENLFDIEGGYDLNGQFPDYRTNSVYQGTSGRTASPSRHSWDEVSLPKEDTQLDPYGSSSDGFSQKKFNNFLLDELEWDSGELDVSNGLDEETYEEMTFGLYSIGSSESHSADLMTLRDMLSMSLSPSAAVAGSPPHSPNSELDNAVFFHQPSVVIGNSHGFPPYRQKFRRTNRKSGSRDVTGASDDDDNDDNESLLSAISEHTEPDYLSD